MARTGTRPQRASIEVRNAQAISMALAGASYDDIAQALGYANRSGAWKAVNSALRARTAEGVDDYRALEMSRLDALQSSLWADAMSGNVAAVQACLKIVGTRIKLLGLELPPRLEDETRTVVVTSDDFARTMKRIALNDPTAEL